MSEWRLRVPGRYDQLAVIADFVGDAARDAGLDDDEVFHVQVAVDEACTNIIEHAYGGEDRGEITLHCQGRDGDFVVTIHDQGAPFDPSAVPEPQFNGSLEGLWEGSFGLYFIRRLMDEVHFHFDPVAGNRLTLVKRGTS